uniref:Uncharacterized protein n=1 Tax=Ascaris lumbricoides TaxID=6252 RepID=A0A0M3I6L0_ASCLU
MAGRVESGQPSAVIKTAYAAATYVHVHLSLPILLSTAVMNLTRKEATSGYNLDPWNLVLCLMFADSHGKTESS